MFVLNRELHSNENIENQLPLNRGCSYFFLQELGSRAMSFKDSPGDIEGMNFF